MLAAVRSQRAGRDGRAQDIVRELLPFIAALLVVLFLITFVPSLVLALPALAGYSR